MQQRKILALFVTLLFVCAVILGAIVIVNNSEPTDTSSDIVSGSEPDTEASSEAEISVDVSDDTSDESLPSDESSEVIPEDSVVSFLACPDNIVHPSVYYDALEHAAKSAGVSPDYNQNLHNAEYDFKKIYEYVAPAIKDADLSYINVETLIGGTQNPVNGYPTFNTPAKAGETLIDLGFDVYNLAHNHMLDSYNDTFLKNCNKFFTDNGQTTIGYYENEADTSNIKIVEVNGVKIAFLSYTFSTNGISWTNGGNKTYIPYFNKTLIDKQVEIAKQNADFIIASCHWGNEDSYNPTSHQKEYASYLINKNVDVVLGMHPHVIQPMEWRDRPDGKKGLVVYSLGNFVSGMQDGFNMLGGMLSFDIRKTHDGEVTFENVIFDPIVTHYEPKWSVKPKVDTGYRNFKIYYLKDYTDELASRHNVPIWDRTHTPTLVGGAFNVANLNGTVSKYIPAEFLRDSQ